MTQTAASTALAQPTIQRCPCTCTTPKTWHSTLKLNEVFWNVFSDMAGWQSMTKMTCYNTARIDYMTTTKFPASLTGSALNECLKTEISKIFIAYLESARVTSADGLVSANF